MKLFRINSLWTALRSLVGWPMLALGLYAIAAFIGSVIPVNSDWEPPKNGYEIYLHDNGIHTSIILPRNQDLTDLNRVFPSTHLPKGPEPFPYLMFGWGDRDFYLNTPTWGDISPSIAVSAFVGSGQALLHVDHLNQIPKGVKKLTVEHETYQKILSEIIRTSARKDSTEPLVPIAGYGNRDVFYAASGKDYSVLHTCNNWVSGILAKAGIKTGYWTPLPFGVMWWH